MELFLIQMIRILAMNRKFLVTTTFTTKVSNQNLSSKNKIRGYSGLYFLLFSVIIKVTKNLYKIKESLLMVKKTKKNIENNFSDLFDKLNDFLKKKTSIKSLADIFESINSIEIFDINRYIYLRDDDDDVSSDDLLADENWLDFIQFIKDGLLESKSGYNLFDEKFNELSKGFDDKGGNIGYINNHLEGFRGLLLSFDLDYNDFSISRVEHLSYYVDEQDFYYKRDSNNNVEINSLFLLSFSDLKSIESIAKNIDKRIVRAYLKYVSEIISAEEFASEVIKEIESRLDKIKEGIFDKMLGLTIPRFDLHPVSIYSEEELENFFIKNKENFRSFIESGFFEKVLSGDKDQNYFYDFLKSKLTIENLSEELLLEVISIENCSLYIEGYSDLNTEDKREYVFKLLKEHSPENPQYYDHHILKNVYDCQVFDFIKNTYKYYLNKFISGDSIKEEEFLGVMISNNQNNKFVLFRDDYFSKPYLYLSEEQISELKSELIPLLEKIQDKFYLSVGDYYGSHFFDPDGGFMDLAYYLRLNLYTFFYQLFDLLEWQPKKLTFVQNVEDDKALLNLLETYSFMRVVKDNPDFDCNLILKFKNSVDLGGYNKDKILKLTNKIVGDNVIVLFDDDTCEEMIVAERLLPYTKSKHLYSIEKR